MDRHPNSDTYSMFTEKGQVIAVDGLYRIDTNQLMVQIEIGHLDGDGCVHQVSHVMLTEEEACTLTKGIQRARVQVYERRNQALEDESE